jgi:PPOX class probable F420-dependent enzyme
MPDGQPSRSAAPGPAGRSYAMSEEAGEWFGSGRGRCSFGTLAPMGVNQRSAIRMSPEEVDAFLQEQRTATMCTVHPDGSIHAVAMSYGFVDGALAVETKRKSQKVQNVLRDPRVTFLVDAGDRYEELRGVEIVGRARVVEDPEVVWKFGVTMFERHVGPYSEDERPMLEQALRNRVVIVVDAMKVVSWDHRKLSSPTEIATSRRTATAPDTGTAPASATATGAVSDPAALPAG